MTKNLCVYKKEPFFSIPLILDCKENQQNRIKLVTRSGQGVATAARSLPIHSAKKRFLEEVVKHETVILIGETGSGKTTQIPQFLHGAKLHLGSKDCRKIGVTQPRRVAAIALARRVNQEMAATIPANSTGSNSH